MFDLIYDLEKQKSSEIAAPKGCFTVGALLCIIIGSKQP